MNEPEVFANLPDEQPQDAELTEAEKAEARNLEIAQKAEKRRLQKAKEDLDAIRAARKETEAEVQAEIKNEAPKVEPVQPPVDVEKAVKEALEKEKHETYLASVAAEIAKTAKSKREALEAYEEAKNFTPSGDPKLDAEFALARRAKILAQKQGFVPPSVGGSPIDSAVNPQGQSDISKFQLEHAQTYGLTADDIRKYRGGLPLGQIFKKGIHNN